MTSTPALPAFERALAVGRMGAVASLAGRAVLLGRGVFYLLVIALLATFWDRVAAEHQPGTLAPLLPAGGLAVYVGVTEWITLSVPAIHLHLEDDIPDLGGRDRRGRMLLVTRDAEEGFASRFLCQVGFIDFSGARNPDISRRLTTALARDWGRSVQSLRRDHHAKGRTCWLHGEGWCLSRRPPVVTRSATS